jgi:acyl-CoA synthetase (AMP-forming)/AMP-acid ligase II
MTYYEDLIADSSPEEPYATVDENSGFLIIYTSGTSGRPKGAVLSHRSRLIMFLAQAMEYKILEDDINLTACPMCHGIGLMHALQQLVVGGAVCIMREFSAEEALRLIHVRKATNAAMVPTMYNLILSLPESTKQRYGCGSMRVLTSAGAPLPTEVKEGLIGFFHDASLIEFYGSSEVAFAIYLKPCDQLKKIRSVGKPFWGVEIKLVNDNDEEVGVNEVGEIVCKSPWLMNGYYKQGREGFRGEWFYTGDLARRDEDGYFYIVDRRTDMIISGGENIYPAEIEEVLYSHPKIFEAAVIGIPDERWGESVKALVILMEGESTTEDEIIEFCKKRLGGFKVPRSISFLTEFPKTTSGKILKRILREEYWKGKEVKV